MLLKNDQDQTDIDAILTSELFVELKLIRKKKLLGRVAFTVTQLNFSVTLRCKVPFLWEGIISKMNYE